MKTLSRIYMVLVFVILYIPILVLILFSFNKQQQRCQLTRSCHNLLLAVRLKTWVVFTTHANLLQDYNTLLPT